MWHRTSQSDTPDGSYSQVHKATPIIRGNKNANYWSTNDWRALVNNIEQNTVKGIVGPMYLYRLQVSVCVRTRSIQIFQYGLCHLQQIWVRSVDSTETRMMNGQDYVTAACMTLRSAAVHLWRRHKAGDLLLLAFHLLFCLSSLHINVLLSVPEWIRYAAALWLSLKIWFPPIHVIATLICSNAILTDLTPSCAHPTNSRSNYFLCLMFALLCWLFHIAHPGEDAGNVKHSHNYVIGNRSVNFQWISAFTLFPGLKYPIIRTQPPVPLRGSVQHQQHTAPTQERVHTHQRIREDDTEASLPDQQSITELSHSSQHCLQITFLLLRIFFPLLPHLLGCCVDRLPLIASLQLWLNGGRDASLRPHGATGCIPSGHAACVGEERLQRVGGRETLQSTALQRSDDIHSNSTAQEFVTASQE